MIVQLAANAVFSLGWSGTLSSLYRSDAWPDPSAPAYVNAVLRMETVLAPEEILGAILAIEAGFSRLRQDEPHLRYAPRTLDLDLLDYEGTRLDTEELTLPHPRMGGRAFVMAPLAEIAPEWRDPVTGETALELLAQCDRAGVSRLPFAGEGSLVDSSGKFELQTT